MLTVDYGHPPWIALVLAFSFGTYGLAKKQAGAEAVESLTLETLLVAPLALGYLAWLVAHDRSTFGTEGTGHALLLMSAGLVTAVPLLCFGAAAIRVPMVTLGLLQYLAPILQFLLGVLWFHEDMSTGRWIGFALVWVALAIFTVESVDAHAARPPRPSLRRAGREVGSARRERVERDGSDCERPGHRSTTGGRLSWRGWRRCRRTPRGRCAPGPRGPRRAGPWPRRRGR